MRNSRPHNSRWCQCPSLSLSCSAWIGHHNFLAIFEGAPRCVHLWTCPEKSSAAFCLGRRHPLRCWRWPYHQTSWRPANWATWPPRGIKCTTRKAESGELSLGFKFNKFSVAGNELDRWSWRTDEKGRPTVWAASLSPDQNKGVNWSAHKPRIHLTDFTLLLVCISASTRGYKFRWGTYDARQARLRFCKLVRSWNRMRRTMACWWGLWPDLRGPMNQGPGVSPMQQMSDLIRDPAIMATSRLPQTCWKTRYWVEVPYL